MKYKDIEVGAEYLAKVNTFGGARRRYGVETYRVKVTKKGVSRSTSSGGVDTKGIQVDLVARVSWGWTKQVRYYGVQKNTKVIPFTSVEQPWAAFAAEHQESLADGERQAKKEADRQAKQAAKEEAFQADMRRRRIKATSIYSGEIRMTAQAFQGLLKRLDKAQAAQAELEQLKASQAVVVRPGRVRGRRV